MDQLHSQKWMITLKGKILCRDWQVFAMLEMEELDIMVVKSLLVSTLNQRLQIQLILGRTQ